MLAIFVSGCATKKIDMAQLNPSGDIDGVFIAAKNLSYDEYGRPLAPELLDERPSKRGSQFTLMKLVEGRIIETYKIFVAGSFKGTKKHPTEIIYEWTGNGFRAGLDVVPKCESLSIEISESGAIESAVILVIRSLPVIVGSAGGFVVGIVASVPSVASGTRNLLAPNKEILMDHSTYYYDKMGRIECMKSHGPILDSSHELVVTRYYYEGASAVPERAEINSIPENRIRTIRP
jgi:hypothetical protein